LQFLEYISEKWYVLDGQGYTILDERQKIREGDTICIPKKAIHRLETTTDMKILEISFGLFQESDIKRLEDDYVR
jgi:mannose-6-phosphate isomerase-like protein (cupin superfamily)